MGAIALRTRNVIPVTSSLLLNTRSSLYVVSKKVLSLSLYLPFSPTCVFRLSYRLPLSIHAY